MGSLENLMGRLNLCMYPKHLADVSRTEAPKREGCAPKREGCATPQNLFLKLHAENVKFGTIYLSQSCTFLLHKLN